MGDIQGRITLAVGPPGATLHKEIDVGALADGAHPRARAEAALTLAHWLELVVCSSATTHEDAEHREAFGQLYAGAQAIHCEAYELRHEIISKERPTRKAEYLILCDTRQRLAKPERWTTDAYARDADGKRTGAGDPEAVCWDIPGALAAATVVPSECENIDALTCDVAMQCAEDRLAGLAGGGSIVTWETARARAHAHVVRLLDEAIAEFCTCANMAPDPDCMVHGRTWESGTARARHRIGNFGGYDGLTVPPGAVVRLLPEDSALARRLEEHGRSTLVAIEYAGAQGAVPRSFIREG